VRDRNVRIVGPGERQPVHAAGGRVEEAREAALAVTTEARLAEMLTQVSAGTWEPPANGISPDPYVMVPSDSFETRSFELPTFAYFMAWPFVRDRTRQ
jgi:hypothetical protein